MNVYVIDSGILLTHQEFSGRVVTTYDFYGGNANDACGHSTHVAGTIGGRTYGIAKLARLYAVRVLNCEDTLESVIAGVDWVTANHTKPAVANVSLGCRGLPPCIYETLDRAVRNSIAAGVTYVIAAGNSHRDARNFSPSSVAEAIVVGASDSADRRGSFSNYGPSIDTFAPGVEIKSAWIGSDSSSKVWDGTAMATPHVTGVIAQLLEDTLGAAPSTAERAIADNAILDKIIDPGPNSPNRLLFSAFFKKALSDFVQVLVADLNGDGRGDLIHVREGGDNLVWRAHLSDGAGGFRPQPRYGTDN